jgi:hypothetical protein
VAEHLDGGDELVDVDVQHEPRIGARNHPLSMPRECPGAQLTGVLPTPAEPASTTPAPRRVRYEDTTARSSRPRPTSGQPSAGSSSDHISSPTIPAAFPRTLYPVIGADRLIG